MYKDYLRSGQVLAVDCVAKQIDQNPQPLDGGKSVLNHIKSIILWTIQIISN